MSQLFNTDASQSMQSSSTMPPASPPIPPHNTATQQMFHQKPKGRLRVKIFGVLAVLLVIGALPTIILLSRQQQNYQSSAHEVQTTISSSCSNTDVQLTSKYVISNVPSGATCQVTASDSQSYLNDSFSASSKDGTHTKTVDTQKGTISPGVVTYKTTCTSGFKDTTQVSYSQKETCITPTPSPSETPVPTETPTPTTTPTPSTCVTPGQIQNVKVSCPNCTGQ